MIKLLTASYRFKPKSLIKVSNSEYTLMVIRVEKLTSSYNHYCIVSGRFNIIRYYWYKFMLYINKKFNGKRKQFTPR